jgi:hypothetical protein
MQRNLEENPMDQRTSGTDIPIGTTRASELNESASTGAVKEKAREIGHRASERAHAAASEQKERATSELGAVASALRDASQRLDDDNMMSGRLIRTAAERLDDFSQRLERRDIDGLMRETRQWARRSPAAFMGAAVAIGFLASRFLKASEQSSEPWDEDYASDYDPYTAVGLDNEYPLGETPRRGPTDFSSGYAPGTGTGYPGGGTGGSFGGGTTGGGNDGRA